MAFPEQISYPELTVLAEQLRRYRAWVIMDIDKTIVDESYRLGEPEEITAAIASLQNQNVLVGLNSDSPLPTIMQVATVLNVHGPHIYEMGGLYFPLEEMNIDLDPAARELFAEMRDRIYGRVATYLYQTGQHRRVLLTKDHDRNREKREGQKYPGYERAVFFNPHRALSLGIWAEGVDEQGRTFRDDAFHQAICQLVSQAFAEHAASGDQTQFNFDFNAEYGVIIVKNSATSSKTRTTQALLQVGYNQPVFMIGDSMSDMINDARVTTLAVGNANPTFIEAAREQPTTYPHPVVAQGQYAAGAAEHLRAISTYLAGRP